MAGKRQLGSAFILMVPLFLFYVISMQWHNLFIKTITAVFLDEKLLLYLLFARKILILPPNNCQPSFAAVQAWMIATVFQINQIKLKLV